MESLEILKQELLTQKDLIETKGGTVTVNGTNPSPSEISAGINTLQIPNVLNADADVGDVRAGKKFFSGNTTLKTGTLNVVDTSVATATAADVVSGKTFYAGSDTLQTGTSNAVNGSLANATVDDVLLGKTFYAGDSTLKTGAFDYAKILKSTIFFLENNINQQDRVSLVMPEICSNVPPYHFWNNRNPVDFYFSSAITEVKTYAFYGTLNFLFPNFAQTNITKIGNYSFYGTNKLAFDYQHWPSTLTEIGERGFQESIPDDNTLDIILPTTLTKMGLYAFSALSGKFRVKSFSVPSYSHTVMPAGCCYYMDANCDFTFPASVTEIGAQFNYRGSFNNFIIPTNVNSIKNYAFGSVSSDPNSWYHLKSVTFLRENPPTIGTEIIASQNLREANNFKIYVPDTAVSTYKAVANLAPYQNFIVGESERP